MLASSSASAVQETVTYPGLTGFKSITYTSEFFGYQSGVNRDFTNYGRRFEEPVVQNTARINAQAVLADINGDGLADFVSFDPTLKNLRWSAGKGDGAFDLQEFHETPMKETGQLAAADINGDGLTDLAFVNPEQISVYFGKKSGGFAAPVRHEANVPLGSVSAGDYDGDGRADLFVHDSTTGSLYFLHSKGDGRFADVVKSSQKLSGGQLAVADFNGDNYCDIALFGGTAYPLGFLFLFGRGDGTFGPTAAEAKTISATHLTARFQWRPAELAHPVAGQVDADGAADIGLYMPMSGLLVTRRQVEEPAYDYSVHMMKDGPIYKMWHGGRWRTLDADGKVLPGADGDHTMFAWSKYGRKWFRKIDGAVFPKGDEIGPQDWWTNNYLEPEVIKLKGKYYMFWQCEIDPGYKVDTGETATAAADRIVLSTSDDGVNWKRIGDRGVVINVSNPAATKLTHHEAIYVPDDKDGKPWWLYTFHFVDNVPMGHVRIRSNDPTTFDWNEREHVSGMSQIGNQVGYADEAPGGRMFFRITFTDNGQKRTVPTLQLSRDGLTWVTGNSGGLGRPLLAGSTDEKNNRNAYFLGMSTVDGTGKLEQTKDGGFRAFYGQTSCNGPGQPEIWFSEIGVGEIAIKFDK